MKKFSETKQKDNQSKTDILITEKNQKEIDRQNFIKKHQQMLSAIVTKGSENLTKEEQAYWMNVY